MKKRRKRADPAPSGRNTRILFMSSIPETLGFFEGFIALLKDNGFEVSALSSPGFVLEGFGLKEGVNVHPVRMPRRISPIRDLLGIIRVYWAIKRIDPQIVHALTPKAGLVGMIGAAWARVPIMVFHMVGLRYVTTRGIKRMVLRWGERMPCRLADRVLCISSSLSAFAISEGLCSTSKMSVIGQGSIAGVDAEGRFDRSRWPKDIAETTRVAQGLPLSAPVIGYVGRLVRDKGVIELAQAWKALREEWPNIHLLLVGRTEKEDPLPKWVLDSLIDDTRVHITGYVPDVAPFYSAMDVLALPSYREGFPNTPLEAAAMGLPVVATCVPGCVDAVMDGVTGSLVPAGDPMALANALRRYVSDPELRQRHGRAGRERVLRDFGPRSVWDGMLSMYRELLSQKGLR